MTRYRIIKKEVTPYHSTTTSITYKIEALINDGEYVIWSPIIEGIKSEFKAMEELMRFKNKYAVTTVESVIFEIEG